MRRLKAIMMVMGVMVLLGMMPVTASAKSGSLTTDNELGTYIVKGRYIVTVGEKGQFRTKYNGKKVTKNVTYKSSNKKVATVSKTGKLKVKKAGNCTITVAYKGQKITWKLKAHKHKWVDDGYGLDLVPSGDVPIYYEIYCHTCDCIVTSGTDIEDVKKEYIFYSDEFGQWIMTCWDKDYDSMVYKAQKKHPDHKLQFNAEGIKQIKIPSYYCQICHLAK